MVTAVIANSKFAEPTRSAMSANASSSGRPSPASVSTRRSSSLAGGLLSSTTACSPCLNECPAFSVAAIVVRRSGSWFSNAFALRRTRIVTMKYGIAPPKSIPANVRSAGEPAAEKRRPAPTPQPSIVQKNSAGRSGMSPRISSFSIDRHCARRPKAPSVARKSAARNDQRSPRRIPARSASPT